MSEASKPWLKRPGECHDKNGVPIYQGDLLKSLHFTEADGKEHWLYHVAVFMDDGSGVSAMRMVPASHLQPELVKSGGSCLLSQKMAGECEIISGHGPGDCLDYTDRAKTKP